MTCGIYKIAFDDGSDYIGKSIDIEKRWEEHKHNFLRNKASAKMMRAYHQFGLPDFEIIAEIHKDHLDIIESYYISRDKPALNSVISEAISDDEYEVLEANYDLLSKSTVEHVQEIAELREVNQDLEDTIAGLRESVISLCETRTKEEVEADCYNNLKLELDLAEDTLRLQTERSRLLQLRVDYLELPWWKKLFV